MFDRHPSASRASPLGTSLLALGAASTGLAPSADGDVWWHLAAGREMLARGELLWTDPFSVSALGRPWHDVHWLFQLAVFAVHRWFGLGGLVLAKCALLGLGAVLLQRALQARRGPWVRGVFVTTLLGGLLACRSLLLVRPVIVTLAMLAFFLVVLERSRDEGHGRSLPWLLPAQVLWANVQGLSALGPALVGAYALGALLDARFGQSTAWPFAPEAGQASSRWSRTRQLTATLSGCLLAACVTPFGWGAVKLPAVLLGRLLPGETQIFARQVAENLPPFELERLSGEFWHFKYSLLLLALAVLAAGRRLQLSHALLALGFATLALMSNRNVLLFYWVSAPLVALYLAPTLRALIGKRFGRSGLRSGVALNAAALVVLGLVSASAALRETSLSQPSLFRAPSGSVARLEARPTGADVFAADHYGGYLIWRLYPRFRPYIDTRLVLRTDDEYAQYLRVVDEPERFGAFQAKRRFGYVVLPVMFPERYQGLIAYLAARPDWKVLFTDGSEALFGRRDLTTDIPEQRIGDPDEAARVRAELAARYGRGSKAHAAALLGLATLHGLLGQQELAERALAGVPAPEADALAARLRFAVGDLSGAEKLARARLSQARGDVRSLNLLAQIALRRGEDTRSLGYLRRALGERPSDPEAQRLLAHLEENRP